MGLMLSVLVFCVGVVEVLDCWHHFLLYLVQPQYNPLPFPLDPHRDILCEKELYPSSDSRRPSNVDISWPRDLSPTDNLHVIRKRVHSESERSFVTDGDSSSRPHTVCGPDSDDFDRDQFSPTGSWSASPNHLELGVISESDSSSEVDEPSQIENLAYKKDCTLNYSQSSLKIGDHVEELPLDESTIVKRADDFEGEYEEENSSSSFTESGSKIKSELEKPLADTKSTTNVPEVTELPDLPVFTDNILSTNVKKVSGRYPSDDISSSPPCIDETCKSAVGSRELTGLNDIKVSSLAKDNIINPLTNYEYTSSSENQSISSILDEGLEPISEFPEMKLLGHSPIPPEQSSESSLNTSDASLLVISKTSDRPLVIRVSPSRCLQQESDPVISSELEAFEHKMMSGSNVNLPKVDDVKVTKVNEHYRDDFRRLTDSQKSHDGIQPQPGVYPEMIGECTTDEKISIQPDTNSSSSSLSGIPQLPEDSGDVAVRPSLPTDNSYEIDNFENDELSTDVSYSITDESHKSSGTSETNYSRQVDSPFSLHQLKDKHLEKESCEKHEPIVPVLIKDINSKNEFISPHHNDSNLQESQHICPENRKSLVVENNGIKDNETLESIKSNLSNITLPEEAEDKKKNTSSRDAHKVEEISREDSEKASTNNIKAGSFSQEKNKSQENNRSSQKRRTKRSARDSSNTTSEGDMPEFCKAKESDEKDHADSRVQTTCVRASPPLGEVVCPKPEPSTSVSAQKGTMPSTSKADTPENKAFWLIFSGEYTKAMNKDWHSGHFCCWQCDESLTGQRYVLRDEHPYCIKCYESVFANGCEECNKTIGIDSKDLSYKDKHWHEACFLCNKCRVSLVDKQFGSKLDKIFCGNCYDAQFASRCDGCGQIFKAGTKKMEYKTRQWHEPCFACCVCKTPIGTKSFIPREQEIYCATCYEEKFATRCVKCNKIITSGGVTYKNEPWHRECFTCTNCSASLAGQRFTSRDEKPYCAECFGELFAKRCTACSKPITGIGGTRFISFEDRHWHNDCFICASCKTSLVGRGFITDAEEIICPECAKQKLM